MTGLTNEQVQERIAEGKVNVNENPNTRTYKQIILENTLTFFNFLNIALLVLVLFVRSYKNSMFMGIILINTVIGIVQEIRAKKNTGILMITHDLGVVAEMCSRVVVMYAGRIVEEAPVQELFADPKHPYTQGLIGSVPKLGSGVESLPSIPGSVPDLSVMPKGCKFAPRCKYAMDICHQQEPELADINEAGTRKCRCHLLNKTGKEA